MNITNPFAPHMTGQLSEETQALVAEQIAKGTLSPYACKNEDIIRRDSIHDQASLLRPAFMRDVEKIMHTPAYNRLNGKSSRSVRMMTLHVVAFMSSLFVGLLKILDVRLALTLI